MRNTKKGEKITYVYDDDDEKKIKLIKKLHRIFKKKVVIR